MRVYVSEGPNDPGREVDPSEAPAGLPACCTMGDLFSKTGYVWPASGCPHHREAFENMRAAVEDNDFSFLDNLPTSEKAELDAAAASAWERAHAIAPQSQG
jgi:hypothetical protein